MADKSQQEGMTRSEAANALDVSVSTIRAWQRNFKSWLEVEEQNFGGGRRQATKYTQADMLVFATVKRLSDEGLRYEQISERLDKELATATFELPEEEATEEPAGQSKALTVTYQQYSAVVASLQGTEGKLEAVTEERDYLRERVAELEDKYMEEVRKSWWQKLTGR